MSLVELGLPLARSYHVSRRDKSSLNFDFVLALKLISFRYNSKLWKRRNTSLFNIAILKSTSALDSSFE